MTEKGLQVVGGEVMTTESGGALLTRAEFHQLSNVLLAVEWFADIDNPNTRATKPMCKETSCR